MRYEERRVTRLIKNHGYQGAWEQLKREREYLLTGWHSFDTADALDWNDKCMKELERSSPSSFEAEQKLIGG